jgi:hypothetical protein
MTGDRYRPLLRADCDALARHHNRNRREPEPIWCARGGEASGTALWLHRLVLIARGRGRAISQVHERDGRPLSYFGGYGRDSRATFSLGIVDLDLPDLIATWRRDAAHLFAATLQGGAETFRVQTSSDRGRFVGWLEREVGATRLPDRNVWTADRTGIARYLGACVPDRTPRPDAPPSAARPPALEPFPDHIQLAGVGAPA